MIDPVNALVETAAVIFRAIFWIVIVTLMIIGIYLYVNYQSKQQCEQDLRGVQIEVGGKKTCVERGSLKVLK